MSRMFYRKLIDKAGNVYCITIPSDVDPENITEIFSGIHDNIVKLKAYQLAGDIYRLPDNVEHPNGAKEFTFYKKVPVFEVNPEITQEDFSEAIKTLIDNARGFKINKPNITSFEGKPVKQDSRGYYLEREIDCTAEGCEHKIKGIQRLSMSDGIISRAQAFIPDDPKVQRVRPGSKQWFCKDCAVKHTTYVAEPSITKVEKTTKPKATPESVPTINKTLTRILEMSKNVNGISAEYFKGYTRGVLEMLIGVDDVESTVHPHITENDEGESQIYS